MKTFEHAMYCQLWRLDNPKKINFAWKSYYRRTWFSKLMYRQIFRLAFPEIEAANKARSDKKNKETRRKYENHRRKTDPVFRLKKSLRDRIRDAIKGNYKKSKSYELLGCSISEYYHYLQNRFLPGMCWENYGFKGWHIDHIKPLSSFDLSTLEGQKAAFHYTNTQPLWAVDNLRKHDKV